MSFIIKASFIDVFKIGDNINFNLKILRTLYEQYDRLEDKKDLLIKPIIIINTSVAEAILYDFIENRIRRANKTEVLFSEILDAIRGKKLDKFEHYITQAQKYDFFDAKDTKFYEAMHGLRKKRNRIHIQNSKNEKPRNESEL